MRINRDRVHQLLEDFEFETLFIEELGWDFHTQSFSVQVDEVDYFLTATAKKRGMGVYVCTDAINGGIPESATRRKIEHQVAQRIHEHLIIFIDDAKTAQLWQWVKREEGTPPRPRDQHYHSGQQGEILIQKLAAIAFSLDEELDIGVVDVASRVREAFDVEGVTKRFYEHFKTEHDAFFQFLKGIPDQGLQRWYVSVILNRLMFIYFIQKRDFLNDDIDYLRTNLRRSKNAGRDQYYNTFLCPLFFEGFATREENRSGATKSLLGDVPYLNGGIFQQHQIEQLHGETIQIADAAFERLFNFFEHYQWHLDDRLERNDNEINPEVLGYIFEKYINQKQMGAYYTKEDITEYIGKNIIIPFLLDATRKKCKMAFRPPVRAINQVDNEGSTEIERANSECDRESGLRDPPPTRDFSAHDTFDTVWQLMVDHPDRYIYASVKKGVKRPLPAAMAVGVDDASKRTAWNLAALPEYALPTEIWREVVARRERYKELFAKLSNGEIHEVDDLITYNLHIRQFARDIIKNCKDPELLRAFWKAIKNVTILDPTCGSGAFLFAALNILEPLYEACLDRMQVFLDELETSAETSHAKKYSDFREILNRVDEHPNRKYFILKSIIINNLYGVDIMEEAIEICKLRLFLKMVAQIADVNKIEPLPDIDFNIKAGNTLVGYATYDEVEKAVTNNKIDFDNTMGRIKEQAEDVEALFDQFRLQQTEFEGEVTPAHKRELQGKLIELENELNEYFAGEYGIDSDNESDYEQWLTSHKPFHWFVEFYGILRNGGFDVIIGNPPYVEYSKVKKQYTVSKYKTEKCGNLYAMSIERSMDLAGGPVGMIVQLPLVCTDRMIPAQLLFKDRKRKSWFASFDDRPGKLFDDLQHIRATIFLSNQEKEQDMAMLYATKYNRWFTEARSTLFEGLAYGNIAPYCFEGVFPKMADYMAQRITSKLKKTKRNILNFKTGKFVCRFHNAPQYWIRATDFVPYFWNERDGRKQSVQIKDLRFTEKTYALAVCALLNSSIFYWWFIISSDCRHLNIREIINFSFAPQIMDKARITKLSEIAQELMHHYQSHTIRKETNYKTTGKVVYDEFYPRHSKSIIDRIDRILGEHYGFSDEELDFIINYDIKYRMGLGSD